MIVVLQAGHGGRTTGAVGAPGEQAYAARVCARAKVLVEELGVTARVIDADPPSTSYRGDIFVAVHYDGGSPGARGASVGFQTDEGKRLAWLWKDAYAKLAGPNIYNFRRDNYTANLSRYYGVRKAVAQGNRAAIITEGGFGTHPREGAWLRSHAGIEAGALAIRHAVAQYAGLTAPKPDDVEETVLKVGDKGPAVRLIQRCLIREAEVAQRPKPLPKYGPDGDYGKETESAVAVYQGAAKVPITGQVDGLTAAFLLRYEPK